MAASGFAGYQGEQGLDEALNERVPVVPGTPRRDPAGWRHLLARRQVLKGAAVVAVGVPLLGEAMASPAAATTTAGTLAPAVVTLVDAPEISVDASAGNDFRVTLSASRIMGTPVNPTGGQQIVFQVTQGQPGSCVLTWSSGYRFPGSAVPPTLSTSPGQTDLLGFLYDASSRTWFLTSFVGGFG